MIYFIQAGEGGPVKIGYTENPVDARLATLQTGAHEKLTLLTCLPGGMAVERWLHTALSHLRVRGEWFRPDGELAVLLRWRTAAASGNEEAAYQRLEHLCSVWPKLSGDAREAALLMLNYHSRMLGEEAG